ncbi:phage tail protein [Mannheimia sp. AT1]|uniref:Phage tail protein n=1 Tax=Mannheimia cairinae TaxID=3025936 RepID=A0ABT5MQ78_9PAST|nr:phage tail protein [Mannheimia cairinae]MDD0823012.1 phage tail protein [Mannheimia cairinae]MDD0825962.1 phage tail protein [Mannheimia cairinae]
MPMVVPIIASVAAAAITTSAAVISAIGGIGAAALGMAAAFTITTIGSKLTKAKAPSIPQQDLKRTIKEAASNRRIIYGTVRAGGILVYASVSDKDNKYLDMVLALSHGRIHEIDPIFWLNDDKTDNPKFDGLVSMYYRRGHNEQSAMLGLVNKKPNEWTENHTLNGVAYAYVRLKYDPETFQNGVPNVSFLIKGRPVYDPRIRQMVHSNNPALCILDWLRAKEGKAVPNDLIDFESFITAANICDEEVPSKDNRYEVNGKVGFVKRYTLDGVIDMSAAPSKIIEDMQSSCHGNLVFSQGKYRFYAGAYSYPSFTITTEMLREAPTVRMKPSRNELFNIVSGSYIEPSHNWNETDFPPQRDNSYIKRYQGEEIKQDIKLPYTTNGAIAQRLAKIQLVKGNNTITVSLSCNWAALPIRLWDVVELNIPEIFQVGTAFRVTEFSFAEGGGIDLTLSSERPEFYYWNYLSDEKIIESTKKPESDDGKPSPVTDLVISGEPKYGKPYLSIRWTRSPNTRLNFTFKVIIERRDKNETTYRTFRSFTTSETEFSQELPSEDVPYLYRFKVQTNLFFSKSDWVISDLIDIKTVSTPPEPPSYLSVSNQNKDAVLRWKSPNNIDFSHNVIYRSELNNVEQATLLVNIKSMKGSYNTYLDTIEQSSYYWISSVDISGNESDKIFAGSVII